MKDVEYLNNGLESICVALMVLEEAIGLMKGMNMLRERRIVGLLKGYTGGKMGSRPRPANGSLEKEGQGFVRGDEPLNIMRCHSCWFP